MHILKKRKANRILLMLLMVIIVGCVKNDAEELPQIISNDSLNHAELGFELDEPHVILNELPKGTLNNSINSIFLVMYGNTYRKWEFEYLENSHTVDRMIFYLPHYQNCEKNIYEFEYNLSQTIKKVVSTRTNLCNEFEAIKSYTFNYNNNGLLKSIFMDSQFTVQEHYIGYYPNGKIKEIWSDSRGAGDNVNFGVTEFYYDEAFNNVIRIEKRISSQNYTYWYEYDDKKNPFKGFFITNGIFLPHVGPSYLSDNNVISLTVKNNNNIHNQEITYPHYFEYATDGSLIRYGDNEGERTYYINQ